MLNYEPTQQQVLQLTSSYQHDFFNKHFIYFYSKCSEAPLTLTESVELHSDLNRPHNDPGCFTNVKSRLSDFRFLVKLGFRFQFRVE